MKMSNPLYQPITPKSDIAICSFATGNLHEQMLDYMKPTFENYCQKHYIDLYIYKLAERLDSSRPASWDKVLLIRYLLQFYKSIIWVDSDTMIANPNSDIRNDLDFTYPTQLVSYHNIDPIYPNLGVWVLNHDPKTFELLDCIWSQTDLINHPWWEQGALLKLIGYSTKTNELRFLGSTKYSPWIGKLDLKWNSRPFNSDCSDDPVILHYCGILPDQRLIEMEKQFMIFSKDRI
jgi:hypothetical protein